MKGQNIKKNNSMKTKSIILSIVSIIELIILLSTMTFAWFEGLTSLEIKGSNLSTASGLKSKFIVGEGTEYQTIAELNEFFHKQSFDKLSPVSSWDGDNFYAITTGDAPATQGEYITAVNNKSITFRKLSEEEKLSSIVHFQFEISSDSSDTDFWFKELPVVKINGNPLDSENNPFRFSIDDGTGYAPNGENNYNFTTCVNWPGGSQNNMRAVKSIDANGYATLNNVASESVANRAIYSVFGSDQNEDGKYKLFTVPKGKTKIITIAIWIEAFDPAYSESIIPPGATVDIDIEFCSSWNVVDEVVFRDYTSDQWIDEVDEDQSNKAMKFGAVNLDSPSNYYYPFEYDSDNKQWTANIPRAVQNIKFVWQGENDTTEETAKWENIDTRENKTVFTAFGSTAGFWYDGKVDKITFSDYTGTHWVNNQIDSQSPKMKVQITYGGNNYSYSMSDAPTKDSSNKNVWHTYVPDTIETVIFNRYSRSDSTTPKHTWNGTDRIVDEATGTVKHTMYYALDGEVNDIDTSNIIPVYLKVANSCYDKFFTGYTSEKPSISLTCLQNINNINNLSNLTALKQTEYLNANLHHDDHWNHSSQYPHSTSDLKPGTMVPVGETGIYAFYFDKADLVAKAQSNGGIVYLTFWSENHSDFGIVDNNVRLAAAIPLQLILSDGSVSKNTVLAITEMELITGFNPNMNNEVKDLPYICTNYAWYPDSVIVQDPNLTTQGTAVNGQWGAPALPEGSFQTYFVHTGTATTVTAKFEYYGTEHSVEMTKSTSDTTGRTWWAAAKAIPDDVTSIEFTDGTNTWTIAKATGNRSETNCYFYATSTTAGKWSAKITPPSGTYKTYFVPPSGNTATSVTATFTYNGVPFTVSLSKDGEYWSTQGIPNDATNIVIKDNAGHTWTTGTGRTSTNCYFMATSNTAGTWGKPATATKTIYLKPVDNVWDKDGAWFWVHAWGGEEEVDVKMTAVSGQSGLYSAEIPEDTTQVVFVRMNPSYTAISWDNGKWNQTVDLTIPSDSDTFTMTSSTNGTWYEPETEPDDPVVAKLYLNAGVWNTANAEFRAWVWGNSSSSDKWIYFTDSDGDGIYETDFPEGYTNIIFLRAAPNNSNWNGEWNRVQTTISTSKNLFSITGWGSNGISTGSWSNK